MSTTRRTRASFALIAFIGVLAPALVVPLPAAAATTPPLASLGKATVAAHQGTTAPVDALDQRPMAFEQNKGQIGPAAAFYAHGGGYGVALNPTDAVIALEQIPSLAGPVPAHPKAFAKSVTPTHTAAIDLHLDGASATAPITGSSVVGAMSNYFSGALHIADVASYAGVQVVNAYPGINVGWGGGGRHLGSTFTIVPGGNPAVIQTTITGATSVSLGADGTLSLAVDGGALTQPAPVAYEIAPNGAHLPVAVHFLLASASNR